MSTYEQLKTIEENVKNCHCPAILFAMNKRVQELQRELEQIEKLTFNN